jgi:circadian clock protein KaiC
MTRATTDTEGAGSQEGAGETVRKAATGIPGIDAITRGGFPEARTTLILGGPGAGKTVLALESMVNAARLNHEPGIFVAFEESSRQIIANAATFGWDLPSLEREKLFFLDARVSPMTIQSGDFDITLMLAGLEVKAREMGARRIVLDGLDVLLALLDDPVRERQEVYRLHDWLQKSGLTAVITGKATDVDRHGAERYAFMQFMVDAVILLHHRMVDRVSLRGLRVAKYRGTGFDEGEFPMVISPTGIQVATFGPAILGHDVSTERVSTGIPRLDNMLDGGYYRGSSVLVSGAPGVAKTTLAASFARATCAQGERMLFVSFDEAATQLVRNLQSVGIDLAPFVSAGLLRIHAVRSESRSAEDHLIELQRIIREFEPRGLVLDPISALGKTGGEIAAVHSSLRLLDYARALGITALSTSLMSQGANVEATSMEISTIADTWIPIAYAIHGGERNRTLTVVKSRGMRHSNQVRELILSDAGVTLADVFTAGGEVLVGTARWEYERSVRERAERERLEHEHRRRVAEQNVARLEAQIAGLRAELEAQRSEMEVVGAHELNVAERRQDGQEALRRLRFGANDAPRTPGS